MKQFFAIICVFLMALSLAACKSEAPSSEPLAAPSENGGESRAFTIVDGAETGELVLAGQDSGEVYTLTVGDIPVFLDGEPADASALLDGQTAHITLDPSLETAAGLAGAEQIHVSSLGSKQEPGGAYFDLCGLYLEVLEDLWEEDSGLNSDVTVISVDLSNAPGDLTEAEKEAVAHVFASHHNAEALTLTYQQLGEAGYLGEAETNDRGPVFYPNGFEDGLLFSISAPEGAKNTSSQLHFRAQKYRGPLGALFFEDCCAMFAKNGSWDSGKDPAYKIGGLAVS